MKQMKSPQDIAEEKYPAAFVQDGVYYDDKFCMVKREAFIAGMQEREKDAVEFAEWININALKLKAFNPSPQWDIKVNRIMTLSKLINIMGRRKKACPKGIHSWSIAGFLFILYDLDIPEGTPCDCGKMLWHEEIKCQHCGEKIFKPIDRIALLSTYDGQINKIQHK